MASEYEELVAHLLYALAISGEDGLDSPSLGKHVQEFYDSKYAAVDQTEAPADLESLLFTDEPPNVKPTIDSAFVSTLWESLSQHKDVSVSSIRGTPSLITTEDRVWQALAGHGPDVTKIKGAEFALLRIIAKHGPGGIVQPDLVKQSEQDKRSVPKRTDALARNGYITKRAAIAGGTRTSILTLSKYAEQASLQPDIAGPDGRMIYYDVWFDKLIEELEKNDRLIVLDDLRLALGIKGNTQETKALNRCVRRLLTTGLVSRAKAKQEVLHDNVSTSHLKCLRMVRDPTANDRAIFKRQDLKLLSNSASKAADEASDDDLEDDRVDVEDFDIKTVKTSEGFTLPPQWSPDTPIQNQAYELISTAGTAGFSTKDIQDRFMGPAWRRPIDELLVRISEQWKTSQPAHLRHLGIIQDTGMQGRTHYFLYRTRPAFEAAVAEGLTFWEAVDTSFEKVKKKTADLQAYEPAVLDPWGFPIIDKRLLAGAKDGCASLTQCEQSSHAPPSVIGRPRMYAVGSKRSKRRDSMSEEEVDSPRPRKQQAKAVATRLVEDLDVDQFSSPAKSKDLVSPASATPAANDADDDDIVTTPASVLLASVTPSLKRKSVEGPLLSPGTLCEINPDGALDAKMSTVAGRCGRPPKSKIMVVNSPLLKDKSWFVVEANSDVQPLKRVKPTKTRPVARRVQFAPTLNALASIASPVVEADSAISGEDSNANGEFGQSNRQQGGEEPTVAGSDAEIAAEQRLQSDETTSVPPVQDLPLTTSAAAGSVHEDSDSGASDVIMATTRALPASTGAGPATPVTRNDVSQATVAKLAATPLKSGGVVRGSGAIAVRRTKVILDIIKQCGGVYPGNREIFVPVSAALNTVDTQIDINTVENSVKGLLQRGKLRKLVFLFDNGKGIPVERAILAEPHIMPGDPIVKKMQMQIEQAHPGKYLPVFGEEPPTTAPQPPYRSTRLPAIIKSSEIIADVVQRTPQALEMLAKQREDLEAKGLLRRPKLARQPRDDDSSDDDIEDEIEPGQAAMMGKFQLAEYEPGFAHAQRPHAAFRSLHPRKAFPSSFKPRARYDVRLDQKTADLPWYTLAPGDLVHHRGQQEASQTHFVPTKGLPLTYSHHGWVEQPGLEQRATRRIARLDGLGSHMFSNRFGSAAIGGRHSVPGMRGMHRTLTGVGRPRRPLQAVMPVVPVQQPPAPKAQSEAIFIEEEQAPIKKRDRRSAKMFHETERLMTCVALFRAIVGGIDQRCNWGVISHMLSFRWEPDFLRRRWDSIKNAREEGVRSTMELIYPAFLRAYERGEVERIDFSDLAATDWVKILEWFESSVVAPGGKIASTKHELPQDVDAFHKSYIVSESNTFWERSRDSWFTSSVEKSRKDVAHEYVYGNALPGHARPIQLGGEGDTLVLKSLIRAIALTKPATYDPAVAAGKLAGFDHVAAVCDEMLTNRTLRHLNKGRQQPGRNYEIHDATWSVFRRWPGRDLEWQHLRQVAKARENILRIIDVEDAVTLNYHSSDFEITVLMNMARQGLLKVVTHLPERNDDFEAPFPKLSAWGYAGYSYNAKTLDREKLRFPILFEKTEEYDDDHGLITGVAIPLVGSTKDARVPFWVDINGELLPEVWDIVLRSVLHVVVYRTGVGAAAIEDAHQQRLAAWEIELVLRWMHESGIAEPYGPGEVVNGFWNGGWKASEWWYCAFTPEMITWPMRNEI